MERHAITSLFIRPEGSRRPAGVIHLHDLLRAGVVCSVRLMARRSLWRRLRRATRDPRNAALARAIGGFSRALGALPMPAALAVGPALGTTAHALLATPRRPAAAHMGLPLPELDLATRPRLVRA